MQNDQRQNLGYYFLIGELCMLYILNLYIVYSPKNSSLLTNYEPIISPLDGDKDDEEEEGFEGRILCFMM